MILIKPYYEIEQTINGEEILKHLEKAARTCYKSEHKIGDFENTKKFILALLKRGHESTIEHFSVSVRFIVDRGVTHELVRHRLVAYSQESTRYCSYDKDQFGNQVTFILPPWVKIEPGEYNGDRPLYDITNDQASGFWFCSMLNAEADYLTISKCGWSPQQARSVLPNSLKTEIVATANLREWRHIFKLRTSIAAHPQMREIMIPLLKEFKEKIPVLFDDIKNE
jgi:thymidylate synthase (FAD)